MRRKIMVDLWLTEDFKVKDVAEEGALDEVEVKSYAINMVKLYILHRIIRTLLTLPISIIDNLTM